MHAKRREAGDASRRRILDAASRLIADRGYDGTSVALLGQEVGLPNSSVYWHFGSKEGVMAAVMERGIERFVDSFRTLEHPHEGRPDGAAPGGPAPAGRPGPAPSADAVWRQGEERLRARFTTAARALLCDPAHAQFLQIQLGLRLTPGQLPGSDVQQAVGRVRRRGAAFLAALVRGAFAGQGPAAARRLGDELGQFAMALIDGMFLATRPPAAGRDVEALLEDAATSLVAVARTRSARVPVPSRAGASDPAGPAGPSVFPTREGPGTGVAVPGPLPAGAG